MEDEKLWEKILTKISYFLLTGVVVAATIWVINNDVR